MAEEWQPFRFRLPWFTTPSAPRLAPGNQTQRPPFLPPGIAPTQPTPRTQPKPRTEQPPPPPPSPSPPHSTSSSPSRSPPPRAATQPQLPTQPSSPNRAPTQSRSASLPSSPSRGGSESEAASKPVSPSQAASQPQSPSRLATNGSVSKPSSPSNKLEPTIQETSQTLTITETPSSISPQEPNAVVPQEPSQETQSKKEAPSNTVTSSQIQALPKITTQPNELETVGPQVTGPEVTAAQNSSEPQPKIETPSNTLMGSQIQAQPKITIQPNELETVAPQLPGPEVAAAQHSSEPQPKIETPSNTITGSQIQAQPKIINQTNELETVGPQLTGPEVADEQNSSEPPRTPTSSKKSDSSAVSANHEPLSEPRKSQDSYQTPEKTTTELINKPSDSKTQTTDRLNPKFQAEENQPEKQETLDSTKVRISSSGTNEKQTKTVASPPKYSDNKEFTKLATEPMNGKPVSVTTIAGDNKGAFMQMGSESDKKEGSVHIHRGYKLNPDESGDATTDGEGSSNSKKTWSEDPVTREEPPTKTYINSNVQCVNNSILFNTSVTTRNPGVQMAFYHNLIEPNKPRDKPEPIETHKAEFNVTPAQKLTYEPIIRRRCLRGLFMESSDSDPDNPEKPRRHGCRYSCGEKSGGNKIDIL